MPAAPFVELDLAKIESHLRTSWLGRSSTNELWAVIDSTNSRAKELAISGCAEGTFVIASAQSAGRGRSGRSWHSPANSGLYMSFILRPQLEAVHIPVVTLLVGVAVAQAIQDCLGVEIGLKWVNDLIIEGKKIGGILAEYQGKTNGTEQAALIIGVGLNLYSPPAIPTELEGKIGFLQSYISTGINVDTINKGVVDGNQLIAAIANELEIVFEKMLAGGLESLLNRWRAYAITLGEEVKATVGGEEIIGQALDIDSQGGLIVKTKSGNKILPAGEISIRKSDGSYI